MQITVMSNCDLTYEVVIGDTQNTLTYAELRFLHSEIEKCLEWDKPHVEPDTDRFIQELVDRLRGEKT